METDSRRFMAAACQFIMVYIMKLDLPACVCHHVYRSCIALNLYKVSCYIREELLFLGLEPPTHRSDEEGKFAVVGSNILRIGSASNPTSYRFTSLELRINGFSEELLHCYRPTVSASGLVLSNLHGMSSLIEETIAKYCCILRRHQCLMHTVNSSSLLYFHQLQDKVAR